MHHHWRGRRFIASLIFTWVIKIFLLEARLNIYLINLNNVRKPPFFLYIQHVPGINYNFITLKTLSVQRWSESFYVFCNMCLWNDTLFERCLYKIVNIFFSCPFSCIIIYCITGFYANKLFTKTISTLCLRYRRHVRSSVW